MTSRLGEIKMNKNDIDRDAEREAAALKAVGKERSPNRRIRLAEDYNRDTFDRLFSKQSQDAAKRMSDAIFGK